MKTFEQILQESVPDLKTQIYNYIEWECKQCDKYGEDWPTSKHMKTILRTRFIDNLNYGQEAEDIIKRIKY